MLTYVHRSGMCPDETIRLGYSPLAPRSTMKSFSWLTFFLYTLIDWIIRRTGLLPILLKSIVFISVVGY
jgi:hypothetical protein